MVIPYIATDILLTPGNKTMAIQQTYQDFYGNYSVAQVGNVPILWDVHRLYHIVAWDTITPYTHQECHVYL